MATYSILWKPSAVKELKKLSREVIPRVIAAVETLASDPFPPNVRKLRGADQTYRVRVSDYRVVYTVEESILLVEVIRIRHRKNAYR